MFILFVYFDLVEICLEIFYSFNLRAWKETRMLE